MTRLIMPCIANVNLLFRIGQLISNHLGLQTIGIKLATNITVNKPTICMNRFAANLRSGQSNKSRVQQRS